MVEAADPRNCHDSPRLRRLHRSRSGRILAQRQMSSRPMIVVGVQTESSPERGFVEDDHVIEALMADQADQAFHVRPLPGRTRRRKPLLHAHVLDLLRKVVAKDSVTISQEIAWCGVPRERRAELLGGPLRRVSRDIEVENAAPSVSQHQEHLENLKPDGRHGEEIDAKTRGCQPARAALRTSIGGGCGKRTSPMFSDCSGLARGTHRSQRRDQQ